ncbi:SGNH/GDSL hydrolase family protein [Acidocella sp. MX-AZ03]|uniref:SGNH/GDSL hydrolase family protein n=1 Tax=Acidocella sp. MX-AZ03 TaxID=2697363 RepID=UPI0022DD76DA|nr:SGNH/GDSL hydrolase family protein [Acidocella sp. MX-AZ03]WBO59801.1 SGNH/GDSL hydrolase family protein [Acidocella sp. MX-AZ03]
MRKTRLLAGVAALSLMAAPAAKAGNLYVFGDSLSDDGNLYKLTGLPPAPYYQGRFSNGPVWVEYLPGLTGLGFSSANDYAYGGAFTGALTIGTTNAGTNLEAAALPGISTEIASFTAAGAVSGRMMWSHSGAGRIITSPMRRRCRPTRRPPPRW